MSQPPDLRAMMQQAQAMQQRVVAAQEAVRLKTVEAAAGGGMVTVVMNGGFELQACKIDPQAIDAGDAKLDSKALALLEDLVVAAVNQAVRRVQELQATEMQSAMGGLSIPGLF